jgi:hypothetical protein
MKTTDVRYKIGAVLAAAGGAVAVLAACGSQTPGVRTSGPGSGQPRSSLTITVTAAQGATPKRWTLTCGPTGGTHPDPQGACATLAATKDPFAPVAPRIMCTMIFSGPQTASITGTWDGRRVSATYSRANGCQTARWDKIAKVLQGVNPGGPMIPAPASTP